jgi:GNAT superfamily N-acetyltransferase
MIDHSEPIFSVSDVVQTVRFYCDVLGFGSEWLWGEPPTFGGARSGKANVMFCQQPQMKGKLEGHQHWFSVEDADAMMEKHRAAGAEIISAIESKPWGAREYTVRDLNGYHLRFGGPIKYERPAGATEALPGHIAIEARLATIDEYAALCQSVGWSFNPPQMTEALAHSRLGVVAVDTRDQATVGMLRICGDGRQFSIWDVMVAQSHQGQKIGSAMIERALAELRKIGRNGTMVALFTGKEPFYERLGFSSAKAMQLTL